MEKSEYAIGIISSYPLYCILLDNFSEFKVECQKDYISHKNHINYHISVGNRENIYLIDLRFIIQEYISTSKTAVRQMAGILSRPNPSAEVIGSPKRDGDNKGHKIFETDESKLIQNNKQVVII